MFNGLTVIFLLAMVGIVCMLAMLFGALVTLLFSLSAGLYAAGVAVLLGTVWIAFCYWEQR
jgi:hypothetical protein